LIDDKNSFVQHAAQIISQVTRNEVTYFWSGGSLPLAKVFGEFNIVPLIIRFGLQEDNIHAASESIKLSQMLKGFQTVKRLIMEL
jgi:acetylornithine deacetylase/succinyl-diaminopimelate desuccinylase-like protein